MTPLSKGSNGDRDPANGRYPRGNPGGPGSPAARHARQIRERLDDALYDVCRPERVKTVLEAILKLAEKGDVQAAKLILEKMEGNALARALEDLELIVAARLTGGTNA